MSNTPAISFRLSKHTTEQLEALAAALGMTKTQVMTVAIDRMATAELKESTMIDKRIKRANDIDSNRPGGWIADMSGSGAINPDCWFRFSTKAQAQEFVALVDSGMTTTEATYQVSQS